MDAQYPFASRDDIWRVFEELKELHATQFEQAERIARLERRREEDAKLKSVWGPVSLFPTSVGGTIPTEPIFHSPADAFKGFDQGQHHGVVGNMGMEGEEEPRRGTSRANSVRFDESAIHGYYGQTSRSTSELPLRTGSGMGSHPLTERSLSHRSDGRLSSSGHSHHSARTNSLGLDITSRMTGSSVAGSPLIPSPGLFILGPVPCIMRCWLTTNFSNDSLLYAAVCSGSYKSSLGYPMIRKLGLEGLVTQEEDLQFIKLPMYLPEASVHQSSSRPSSPVPQLPALTVRFLVRDVDPNDPSIQIVIGSDVLRSHNAELLFSQDKIIMVDDERNRISIPLVRPEDDSAFKFLRTVSDASRPASMAQPLEANSQPDTNGCSVGVIGPPRSVSRQSRSASAYARGSTEEPEESRKTSLDTQELPRSAENTSLSKSAVVAGSPPEGPAKMEPAGVWGSWKRDTKLDSNTSTAGKASRSRPMKVLRPTKSSRTSSTTALPLGSGTDAVSASSQPASSQASPDEARTGKPWVSNPIGGASAFGWLNSSQQPARAVTNPK
ncbi:hypothetical protein ETB97_006427 [Aspergillus alliaceus]|uniref:Ubiquitin carboxyl-terminal hydrolase 19 n=1 Tax=Petromyces alliaceus TaxID=209559 RepID=A0A5N6FSD4_PETAA|nr:uncharacterized protein BDW43DRAFT_133842 [Aspergillus alliaceus]KAB8231820.1 hypothetical protein BDW43DRAFT_133842 [Aspergillus alliaceus]KAE8393198.1 hypothetical protein BDV23DRAFT_191891 [Aspergillus alliaceus]KAF5857000.1 hypothetical protein ETB97_006427 [Aspergillus burnettii]